LPDTSVHSVSGTSKQIFQKRNALYFKLPFVGTLDKQLGQFAKAARTDDVRSLFQNCWLAAFNASPAGEWNTVAHA
jgi:hypothetical protein